MLPCCGGLASFRSGHQGTHVPREREQRKGVARPPTGTICSLSLSRVLRGICICKDAATVLALGGFSCTFEIHFWPLAVANVKCEGDLAWGVGTFSVNSVLGSF